MTSVGVAEKSTDIRLVRLVSDLTRPKPENANAVEHIQLAQRFGIISEKQAKRAHDWLVQLFVDDQWARDCGIHRDYVKAITEHLTSYVPR